MRHTFLSFFFTSPSFTLAQTWIFPRASRMFWVHKIRFCSQTIERRKEKEKKGGGGWRERKVDSLDILAWWHLQHQGEEKRFIWLIRELLLPPATYSTEGPGEVEPPRVEDLATQKSDSFHLGKPLVRWKIRQHWSQIRSTWEPFWCAGLWTGRWSTWHRLRRVLVFPALVVFTATGNPPKSETLCKA